MAPPSFKPEQIGEKERKICFCHNVTLTQILGAISKGSNTLDLIKSDTCASTGCGGCETEVIEILERIAAL
jgi:nitrite reductase (NADH) large subunit